MTRYEYPIINVDTENEHFDLSDSVLSWMECCRARKDVDPRESLVDIMPLGHSFHALSATSLAWRLVAIFSVKHGLSEDLIELATSNASEKPDTVRMRGNDEWAPPRAQIIFNIHEETNLRKLMQKQKYRCAGCGTKIDLVLAKRLVLYCHYFGKYFCKCCYSHKAIYIPGYILQKWDFHKYHVSYIALQLLDKVANEPLFNIDDINPSLYRKTKKMKHLKDIRTQLYFLRIYISTCPDVASSLNKEYETFSHQHLLTSDVHVYSLNNLIEIQHGKLYEYLNDLVTRSITHIAQSDRCRAKGHYCQLCGPSSLMSSMILNNQQQQSPNRNDVQARLKQSQSVGHNLVNASSNIQTTPPKDYRQASSHSRSSSGNFSGQIVRDNSVIQRSDHQLIFPFEIGRVAQCHACGCCFHVQCFVDAGKNCPKCERFQRRRAEPAYNYSVENDGLDNNSAAVT